MQITLFSQQTLLVIIQACYSFQSLSNNPVLFEDLSSAPVNQYSLICYNEVEFAPEITNHTWTLIFYSLLRQQKLVEYQIQLTFYCCLRKTHNLCG